MDTTYHSFFEPGPYSCDHKNNYIKAILIYLLHSLINKTYSSYRIFVSQRQRALNHLMSAFLLAVANPQIVFELVFFELQFSVYFNKNVANVQDI